MPEYRVDPVTVIQEIGQQAYDLVCALSRSLYGGKGPFEFRSAPSLNSRSEAALFGISSPRFVYRAYLTDKGRSFVNLRRLVNLALIGSRSCGKKWPGKAPHDLIPLRLDFKKIWNRVKDSGRCIADSLLEPPTDLACGYYVLTVPLGTAYGETPNFRGTPFIQHIPIGGGMCAQACCFMVLALFEDFAQHVLGIAEITAVANRLSGRTIEWVNIGGLEPRDIVHFFRDEKEVGLWSYRHSHLRDGPNDNLGLALRCYLMSNIPLIFLLDSARLSERLNVRKQKPGSVVNVELRPRPHAVVAVGCARDFAQTEFLINDPAYFPFMRITLREILDSRLYWRDAKGPFPNDEELAPFEFISITASKVKMPLYSWIDSNGLPGIGAGALPRPGLLRIAKDVQTSRQSDPNIPRYQAVGYQPGDFRLIHIQDNKIDAQEIPATCLRALSEFFRQGLIPPKWYWLQFMTTGDLNNRTIASLWLWNAELDPSLSRPGLHYLTVAFGIRESDWFVVYSHDNEPESVKFPAPSEPECVQIEATHFETIKPSLISSFSTVGTVYARPIFTLDPYAELAKTTGDVVPAECYAFMEPETASWFRAMSLWRRLWFQVSNFSWNNPHTAVEFLAQLWPSEIRLLAERMATNFRARSGRIIALASFIPEIARAPNTREGKLAARAIRSLVQLAKALQELGEPTQTIELVAGSLIHGIWAAKERNPPSSRTRFGDATVDYFATFKTEAEGQGFLLETLRKALTGLPLDPPVYLSLELEPGPYFLLSGPAPLRQLGRKLDKDPLLGPLVGFNLDIAHWKLAGIDPSAIDEEIIRRVVHAHISGQHRCAHFGDIPLFPVGATMTQRQINEIRLGLAPWLQILARIDNAQRGTKLPKFSGYVSLELEAADGHDVVTAAFRQLVHEI